MNKTIGILGGMGPAATIDLMHRVMTAVDAADDAHHIPLIVHQNTQVPSRIAHLIEGSGEDPVPTLIAMAKELENAGAAAIAMPCNTAHHYAPAIKGAAEVPFLDMVGLACTHAKTVLPAGTSGKLGLLGSPALAKVGVYEDQARMSEIDLVHVAAGEHALQLIRRIKAEGATNAARADLLAIAADLVDRGAGAICVACTEFSLIKEALQPIPVPVFDAVDLLVDEIVRLSRGDDK